MENRKNNKNNFFKKIALGNFDGEGDLYMPFFKNINLDSLNSFNLVNIKNYLDKYLRNTHIKIKKKRVIIKKLDSFNLTSDFIKIDVEGYELKVLEGSIKHIKKNNPIILIEKNKEFFKIKKFMRKLNYSTYKFYNNKFVFVEKNEDDDIFFFKKN